MEARRLSLHKESLSDLTPAELVAVAGGSVFCTSAVTYCDVACEARDQVTLLLETEGCPHLTHRDGC